MYKYRIAGNFRCKNIFVVCANYKSKRREYILQRIIIIARTFFSAISSTAQLVISCKIVFLILASHSSSCETRNNFSFSVGEIVCLYCHSTCLRRYWVPFCTLVVRQQLHGIHERSMQAVHSLSVRIVLFQITKPGNVEPPKKFWWVSWTTKIFLHENLKHKNFITRKFSDLRYIQTLFTCTCGDVLGMRLYINNTVYTAFCCWNIFNVVFSPHTGWSPCAIHWQKKNQSGT